MSLHSQRLELQGASGSIEAIRNDPAPALARVGVAIIAHPHPLFGGSMDNKVVQTLSRAFVHCGWVALRFNFRGVGHSAGAHDDGRGELEDLLAAVQQVAPDGPLAIAGFSFGAFVASHAVCALWPSRNIERVVLVGTAASRFAVADLPFDSQERTLVLHGELDDTVPLADVMNWARPQNLPITVIPGGGHFFHGQLPLLKSLVVRHLRSA